MFSCPQLALLMTSRFYVVPVFLCVFPIGLRTSDISPNQESSCPRSYKINQKIRQDNSGAMSCGCGVFIDVLATFEHLPCIYRFSRRLSSDAHSRLFYMKRAWNLPKCRIWKHFHLVSQPLTLCSEWRIVKLYNCVTKRNSCPGCQFQDPWYHNDWHFDVTELQNWW